jgi:coenzyme Q-binding protein COQ10
MPTHSEQRVVPYRPDQLFDLVADVGRYPEFLPWCAGARVLSRTDTALVAELTIGFGPFRESFTSHVTLARPQTVHVRYENGPFRYLRNEWGFLPDPAGCRITFFVDFEFRNPILRSAIGLVFGEAVRRMVAAFLRRADMLYGRAESPARTVAEVKPCG